MADPSADQTCEETDRLKQKQVLAENRNLKAWMYMAYTVIHRLKEVPQTYCCSAFRMLKCCARDDLRMQL